MNNGKKVVAIISDRSFYIRYIKIPMDMIFSIIKDNDIQNTIFVYGVIPRIDWHVENYAKDFDIPKENLVHLDFEINNAMPLITSKNFLTVLTYCPDDVYIFRDFENPDTNQLVNECVKRRIRLITIDSDDIHTTIDKPFMTDQRVYYRNQGGF